MEKKKEENLHSLARIGDLANFSDDTLNEMSMSSIMGGNTANELATYNCYGGKKLQCRLFSACATTKQHIEESLLRRGTKVPSFLIYKINFQIIIIY